MKQLDKRLQLVADMINEGAVIADVGTDHAYLPVYLVEQGKAPSAIASDLREGPLSHARQAVEAAGLQDKIDLRLSDGLDAVLPHEADCVVMAGMGGILITQLIERAPWLKNSEKTLVLQPMTDAPLLRSFLGEHGFDVLCERATSDKKHCYTVLKAVYDGVCRILTPLQAVVGKFNQPLGEDEIRFLKKEQASLLKQMKGLHVAGDETQASQLAVLYNEINQVLQGGIR